MNSPATNLMIRLLEKSPPMYMLVLNKATQALEADNPTGYLANDLQAMMRTLTLERVPAGSFQDIVMFYFDGVDWNSVAQAKLEEVTGD